MALEEFSRRKDDAMQVSGSYTAIGSIHEVQPAQRVRPAPARNSGSSGDTVSISEEALAAYRQSLGPGETGLDEGALETGAKFRKVLEEAWQGRGETSLGDRLLSAILSLKG